MIKEGILSIKHANEKYIVHIASMNKRWNSNVGKSLKDKYPEAYGEYLQDLLKGIKFGDISTCRNKGKIICTILGQNSSIATLHGLTMLLLKARGDVALPNNICEDVLKDLAKDFEYDIVAYDSNCEDISLALTAITVDALKEGDDFV